jgi:hypothetical protein
MASVRDPLLDPETADTGELARVLRDYYKLHSDCIRAEGNEERIGVFDVTVRDVPGLDTRVGLAGWIIRTLSQDDETLVREVTQARTEHPEPVPVVEARERGIVGREEPLHMPDGVVVITGPPWTYQ